MDTEILQDLGLTNAEIKTYLSLLELGQVSAGPILERSGVQNSVLHRALATLTEKGLISYIFEGKRKKYIATEPESFLQFIETKKKKFEQILPELKARQQLREVTDATLYKGVKGVTQVYQTLVNQYNVEYVTFGGGKECAQRMGMAWWLNIHTRRRENKIPSRHIFDMSVKADAKDIESQKLTKIKWVTDAFASFQETVICGEYVAITTFSQTPYSFLIKDKNVAEGYKKYFELLWSNAR